jgi:O-antigen/teichoic acid export membrane protein
MKFLKEEWRKIQNSALARNAGWVFVGQGLGFVLQAAYFILLARLLGTKEYGIYAGAFALASMPSAYSTLGTGTLLIRYVSTNKKLLPLYWGNVLVVTSVTSFLVVGILYVAAKHLLDPLSASIVVLCAIGNCFCSQLATCAGQVFQTFEKLRITAALSLLTNLLRFIAAGTMLLRLHHASARQWALASMLVSLIAATTAVIAVTVEYGWPKFKSKLFFSGAAEGFGYSFATSTTSVYNDVDKMMLSHYGMYVANGIYTMAYRVVDIATIPVLSIRDAAMPRFFREGAVSLKRSSELAYTLLKRALPIALFCAAGMFVLAPIIPHIVGEGFRDSIMALRWLCFIPVFRSIHQMTGCALTGAGLQTYRTSSQVAAALASLGLNILLIPRYGWLGAAWGSLLTDGLLALMNSAYLMWLCRAGRSQVVLKGSRLVTEDKEGLAKAVVNR